MAVSAVLATTAMMGVLVGAPGCQRADGGWRALGSLSELQTVFNEDVGHYRLVLLLSPT